MCTNWICYWSITAKGTRKQHRAYVAFAHDVLAFSSIFTWRMVDNCGNSVCIQHIKYLSDSLQWRRLTNNTSPTSFWLEQIPVYTQIGPEIVHSFIANTRPQTHILDHLERCDFQIVMDWKPPIPYEQTVRINNPWQSLASSMKWKIL